MITVAKVTAIIPVYNNADYLDTAIESLTNQNYQNLEVIIVDDGSTDKKTIEVLENIHTDNIKLIRSNHSGPAKARNTGVRASDSEYILFIDSDDYFENGFLQEALDVLVNDRIIGAVSCWARLFGEEKRIMKYRGGDYLNFFIKNESVNAALMKRSVFKQTGGYDESLREGLEDWDFWLKLTTLGYKVKVIEKVLFNYRIRKDSRNQEALKRHEEIKHTIFRKYKDFFFTKYPDVLFSLIERKNEHHNQLVERSKINSIKKIFRIS